MYWFILPRVIITKKITTRFRFFISSNIPIVILQNLVFSNNIRHSTSLLCQSSIEISTPSAFDYILMTNPYQFLHLQNLLILRQNYALLLFFTLFLQLFFYFRRISHHSVLNLDTIITKICFQFKQLFLF